MNKLEYKLIEVLKRLKNDYGVFEIKAEFEAEGSRMEELMRLKDITSFVGLPIILKIGGVEAVTDVYNALSIGVKGIIAPMVETPFALGKYLNMIKTMIAEDNAQDIEFAFNVETSMAILQLSSMLEFNIPEISGITIGRVDLTHSYGLDREYINCVIITDIIEEALKKIKNKKLKTGLGGAISKEALPVIEKLFYLLDKFETRKVVFPIASYKYGEQAIIEANRFELLWLQSKKRYYSRIKIEDDKRIEMLEERIR
jgi:hypothetical protein